MRRNKYTVPGIPPATRSLIEGSDFGDNVLASLPDTIANTIGQVPGTVYLIDAHPFRS